MVYAELDQALGSETTLIMRTRCGGTSWQLSVSESSPVIPRERWIYAPVGCVGDGCCIMLVSKASTGLFDLCSMQEPIRSQDSQHVVAVRSIMNHCNTVLNDGSTDSTVHDSK